MIGECHSGAGFGGLTRYLLHGKKDNPNPERVLWTSTRELALEDPQQAAILMRMTAAQGRTQEPVEHISISIPPHEHLSREQWERVADTTLRDLGLEDHQVLIVAHRDTAHDHIHLVVNRVHPETYRAWNRWQDQTRLMASLRVQERDLGLQPTPYVPNPDRLPNSLLRLYERTGEPPLLDYARNASRPVFQEARSWNELHERLAEKGLYLERKGQGLVVTDDHRHVKASSVDRGASLRALEARLGSYQERQPLLQAVDRDLRAGGREADLTAQIAPLRTTGEETQSSLMNRAFAADAFTRAQDAVRSTLSNAYRDPAEAANRYFAFLQDLHDGKHRPAPLPAELGEIRGTVLQVGRTCLPMGAEGKHAYELAAVELPRRGAEYLRAREALEQAEARHADAERQHERHLRRFAPQLEQLDRIEKNAERLPERLMALRPRDQLAVARAHGAQVLKKAAERTPEAATRTAEHRQRWMRNPSRDLNRALDRRVRRARVPAMTRGQSPAEWMREAIRLGLHPLHAIQVLTRGGLPLADAARAYSLTRAAVRNPVKTGVVLTARAMGLPALPMRLAAMAWNVARTLERVLSR
jgi:hypothetical protein